MYLNCSSSPYLSRLVVDRGGGGGGGGASLRSGAARPQERGVLQGAGQAAGPVPPDREDRGAAPRAGPGGNHADHEQGAVHAAQLRQT